jgi:putative DNA primase/helicase
MAGDDGRCLIHCHHVDEAGVGCTTEAILSTIGLTLADLFPPGSAGPRSAATKNESPGGKARPKRIYSTFDEAVDAILRGLRNPREGTPDGSWNFQARWVYRHADGSDAFAVVRFQNAAGDAGDKAGKQYRPIHGTGDGYAIGDPPGPLPLYHLPDLAGCRRVYLTEGEKCADLVRSILLPATTPSHGAQSPHKSDWRPLAGIEVIILPDADAPGEGFAKAVLAHLSKVTPTPTARILRLPGLPRGGDIEQWLAGRGDDPSKDASGREAARSELDRLADSALVAEMRRTTSLQMSGQAGHLINGEGCAPHPAPDAPVMADDRDSSGRASHADVEEVPAHLVPPAGGEATIPFGKEGLEPVAVEAGPMTWKNEPRPLRSQLLPVPEMSDLLIPEPLRSWLADIAERISCSLDFPVIGAIIGLCCLVGRKLVLRPKRYDNWEVAPNLWGGIVGRPGLLKTPALSEALKPLYRLVSEALQRHDEAVASFGADALIAKLKAEAARDVLKKSLKKGNASPDEITTQAQLAAATDNTTEPTCRRYIVNDTTVEKLGELLRDNPWGLLQFRDELTGWWRCLDKPGHEGDRAFYLEAWNGVGGSFTYDRIGRGTIIIPSPCMSILGGIQPGPLCTYLKAILSGHEADDGLISRFQLLVYPNPPSRWRNVDRWPDTEARDRAFAIFRTLDSLEPSTFGAEVDDADGLPYLRFSGPAQGLFNEWRHKLENKKLRTEGESPLVESHLAKYRSLMPSLALLFHLVEVADGKPSGPVTLEAALLAAAWCDYLEAHARRIYASVAEADVDSARSLIVRIEGGAVTSPFSPRDVYRHGWSNLKNAEEVNRAVAILEDHGWVQCVESRQTGGAPRTDVHIHPSILAKRRVG